MEKILTNKDDERSFTLIKGDLFLSFHRSDGTTVGICFKATSVFEKKIKEFEEEARKVFKNNFSNVELKLVGGQKAMDYCLKSLSKLPLMSVKKVERESSFEVIYSPKNNRVRVSVDNVIEVTNKKVKVLIVDDSKTIRTILNRIFSTDPQFEVIGMLERPSEVDEFIQKNRPDVITLDIHMPEMDGVTLLKKIYPKYKIPCVMISSISLAEGPLVFDALENGAVDYIQKPEAKDIEALTPIIVEKVKMASKVKTNIATKGQVQKVSSNTDQNSLIVLGSSTGGTEAIKEILTRLPDQIPPMLIVQHIPAVFSEAFAKRMNDLCHFQVLEAKNGDEVLPNRVLIAPGGMQMKLVIKNGKPIVEINSDEPVNRFRPSVDYLFDSVEKNMYCHTIAVILTGMGKDGARGMLKLKNRGAVTIAQNEETCIVFGMPREAIAIGAADFIEPIQNMAQKISSLTVETSEFKNSKKNNSKKAGNE
jgi:two-component system chemotaxis response regulator CheB